MTCTFSFSFDQLKIHFLISQKNSLRKMQVEMIFLRLETTMASAISYDDTSDEY